MKLITVKTKAKSTKVYSVEIQKSGVKICGEVVDRYKLSSESYAAIGRNELDQICLFVKNNGISQTDFFRLQARKNSNDLRFVKGIENLECYGKIIGNYMTVKTNSFDSEEYGKGLEIVLKQV